MEDSFQKFIHLFFSLIFLQNIINLYSFFSAAGGTCTFTYTSAKKFLVITATGVERSWNDLKIEFDLEGEGLSDARYYKTISVDGPRLFAVRPDQTVWYFDDDGWHRYQTAKDLQYGQ